MVCVFERIFCKRCVWGVLFSVNYTRTADLGRSSVDWDVIFQCLMGNGFVVKLFCSKWYFEGLFVNIQTILEGDLNVVWTWCRLCMRVSFLLSSCWVQEYRHDANVVQHYQTNTKYITLKNTQQHKEKYRNPQQDPYSKKQLAMQKPNKGSRQIRSVRSLQGLALHQNPTNRESNCIIKHSRTKNTSLWFLLGAPNVNVTKFTQARVNSGSNYDSFKVAKCQIGRASCRERV